MPGEKHPKKPAAPSKVPLPRYPQEGQYDTRTQAGEDEKLYGEPNRTYGQVRSSTFQDGLDEREMQKGVEKRGMRPSDFCKFSTYTEWRKNHPGHFQHILQRFRGEDGG
ncbi:MAG: hypothetical protein Q9162_004982 [Coniocarpon cinnabarinum]